MSLRSEAAHQLVWAYRRWALNLHEVRGPRMMQHLQRRAGYLDRADVELVLGLMTEHCVIASVASAECEATAIRGGMSEVGLEFGHAVQELDAAMGGKSRESVLVDRVLWVEQTGWLAASSALGVYGASGLMPVIAPVLVAPSNEGNSNRVVSEFLRGMSLGRVPSRDARALLGQIVASSSAVSGVHYRASEHLRLNRPLSVSWAN